MKQWIGGFLIGIVVATGAGVMAETIAERQAMKRFLQREQMKQALDPTYNTPAPGGSGRVGANPC